jgi:hypothetical protein
VKRKDEKPVISLALALKLLEEHWGLAQVGFWFGCRPG